MAEIKRGKRNVLIAIAFVFIIFGIAFAGAAGASFVSAPSPPSFASSPSSNFVNNYQSTTPGFQNYYSSSQINSYWPVLGNSMDCKARQDLLLQISPLGCTPAVVPSNLLAQQDVPVFCQIQALKVNPLLDVKEITNVRFSGSYPKEVSGTGFHPARVALSTGTNSLFGSLTGSPLVDNIGYVVVILKKTPREADLPDTVNFTLKATVDYNTGNILGVGQAQFRLREVSDADWQSGEKLKQSFWNGKYFVRAEDIENEKAVIAIYDGQGSKISERTIEKGKTSSGVYLPGGYCQISLDIAYDGTEADQKSARIEVATEKGTDSFDVYKGSSFLNGKCSVRNIDVKSSESGTIQLYCGSQKVDLSLKALSAEAGESCISDTGEKGRCQLGCSDDKIITDMQDNCDRENKEYCCKIEGGQPLNDFTLADKDAEDAFAQAIADYEKVANNYPDMKKDSTTELYALDALESARGLAEISKKKVTELRIINEIIDKGLDKNGAYEEKRKKIGTIDYSQSVKTVKLDNSFRTIKLSGFNIPKQDSSATFLFSGATSRTIKLGSKEKDIFGSKSFVEVNSIETDRARITYNCSEKDSPHTATIMLHEATEVCDSKQTINLESVELVKIAKVRILPKAKGTETETNLSVSVGIEKRAIKLSPEKTKERIQNLDKSIKKLNKISNTLGTSIKTLKTACFATSAILTFKNLIGGFSGEMMARQQVMRGEGGWTDKCKGMIEKGTYATLDACYLAKSDEISKDVSNWEKSIENVNKQIDTIETPLKKSYGALGLQESVNSDEAKKKLGEFLRKPENYGNEMINIDGEEVKVSEWLSESTISSSSYSNMRDLYRNLESKKQLGAFSEVGQGLVRSSLANSVSNIRAEVKLDEQISLAKSSQTETGLPAPFYSGTTRNIPAPVIDIAGVKVEGIRNQFTSNVEKVTTTVISQDVKYVDEFGDDVTAKAGTYALGLKKVTGSSDYQIIEAAKVDGNEFGGFKVLPEGMDNFKQNAGLNWLIKPSDTISYNNQIINPEVKYYESGTFKGMPAVVPFDVKRGWYAASKETLPAFGGKSAFDASGKVASFYLCNVGGNKKIEFESGLGDDICQMINLNTGQSLSMFPGLSESDAKSLISRASAALTDAANQFGKKSAVIGGSEVKVGKPSVGVPDLQCQDFMSPEECLLLFNLCDPVICPTSRCNFGGAYPVQDVVQSGIIGSTLLCLPNIRDPVVIPVCLTGIQAGFDSYTSLLKSHRDCLNNSLATGNMVGICDQLYSIYLCKLFWEQVAPIANVMIPKIISSAYGQGTRGGGEYLTVNDAWKKTDDSMKFFTNYYGVNVLEIFKAKAAVEIGGEVCKAFISAKVPTSFESAINPRSPPQFTAWFSSDTYSSATVPATAQYNVYYHIYAGKDDGVYYNVYLRTPATSSYYNTAPTVQVASGFIGKGDYADETKVFTAPEGYRELCVNVNGQEKCGFKQVTTSFALDQLSGVYANEQASEKDITTESGCISGTPSAGAILSPGSLQSRAQDIISPDVYNSGVVRICSTNNPGSSTNPNRFVEVGFCDDAKMRCWLDKNSVTNAFSQSNNLMRNATLAEVNQIAQQNLQGQGYLLANDEAKKELTDLENGINSISTKTDMASVKTTANSIIARIDFVFDKFMTDEFRARAILLKAKTRDEIVMTYLTLSPGFVEKVSSDVSGGAAGAGEATRKVYLKSEYDSNGMTSLFDLETNEELGFFIDRKEIRDAYNGDLYGNIIFQKNGRYLIKLDENKKERIGIAYYNFLNSREIGSIKVISGDKTVKLVFDKGDNDDVLIKWNSKENKPMVRIFPNGNDFPNIPWTSDKDYLFGNADKDTIDDLYLEDIALIKALLDAKNPAELATTLSRVTRTGRASVNNDDVKLSPSQASILLYGKDVTKS